MLSRKTLLLIERAEKRAGVCCGVFVVCERAGHRFRVGGTPARLEQKSDQRQEGSRGISFGAKGSTDKQEGGRIRTGERGNNARSTARRSWRQTSASGVVAVSATHKLGAGEPNRVSVCHPIATLQRQRGAGKHQPHKNWFGACLIC
jgi:hypothetical protein